MSKALETGIFSRHSGPSNFNMLLYQAEIAQQWEAILKIEDRIGTPMVSWQEFVDAEGDRAVQRHIFMQMRATIKEYRKLEMLFPH